MLNSRWEWNELRGIYTNFVFIKLEWETEWINCLHVKLKLAMGMSCMGSIQILNWLWGLWFWEGGWESKPYFSERQNCPYYIFNIPKTHSLQLKKCKWKNKRKMKTSRSLSPFAIADLSLENQRKMIGLSSLPLIIFVGCHAAAHHRCCCLSRACCQLPPIVVNCLVSSVDSVTQHSLRTRILIILRVRLELRLSSYTLKYFVNNN